MFHPDSKKAKDLLPKLRKYYKCFQQEQKVVEKQVSTKLWSQPEFICFEKSILKFGKDYR